MSETQRLLVNQAPLNEGHASNSWMSTLTLMVGSNAGAAVLGLASATNNSGWAGIALLLFCSIITNYTSHLIGRIITFISKTKGRNVTNFVEIGEEAFGPIGKGIASFAIYVSLVGVMIIYLILIGGLLSGLFPCLPHGFFTFAIGVIMMPVLVVIKTMKEAKWTSYLALSTTYIATIAAIVYAIQFYLSDDYKIKSEIYDFSTTPFKMSIALGFSTYLFSLGAHPIFPSLYAELNDKRYWGLVTNLGWLIVCALYFATAIIGYIIFGSVLDGNDTLLATLSKYVGRSWIISMGEILFCAHFMCAIPIFATPCFYELNQYLTKTGKPLLGDALNRIVITLILIFVAIFFPYFTDVMGFVSNVSTSLAVLILPAIFYWKLCETNSAEKFLLVIIIVFGIVGSIVGIINTIDDLIKNINEHPLDEFFSELFKFNMTLCQIK